MLAPLRALYEQIDREVEAKSRGCALPCKAGCDACCHESVFVSGPELLAVCAALVADPGRLRRVVAAMRSLADRFEDELELLEILEPGAERDEVAARVKFRCPLLSADGRCTVYAARELNGRTFGLTWDAARQQPYGCALTRDRLQVVGQAAAQGLADARAARRRLAQTVPGAESSAVHVYPWWFAHHADVLMGLRGV